MSGGQKTKTDKASEIWFRLNLREDFKRDFKKLKEIRNKFPEYYFHQDYLFRKYYVIPTRRLRDICDAVVFGKRRDEKVVDDEHLSLRIQTPSVEELQQTKRAFVKLWVYQGVSRDEIITGIKKRWRVIQAVLKTQGMPDVQRVRPIKNKHLVRCILKLNNLSTKKLRTLTGRETDKKVYRETLINNLLETKGLSATQETIKGIVTRFNAKNRLIRPD